MEDFGRRQERALSSTKREEGNAALQVQFVFTVWMKNRKIEKTKAEAKREMNFRKKRGNKEASNGVVCGSKHTSVYETWQQQQQAHEHARNM